MPDDTFERAVCRALGLFDLNPLSRTAGCGDRAYWHYQDGKGFSVGSMQAAMFPFAAAARMQARAFATCERAATLASEFWAQRISEDGSLDEYFRGQASFCATAHTTLAAQLLLATWRREARSISPTFSAAANAAVDWLVDETARPDAANQTLAARLAWDLAARNGANPFVPKQSTEGWLSEYGGFDLGYSLHCLDLCALALSTLNDAERCEPYRRWASDLLNFLELALTRYTFDPMLSARGNPHRFVGGAAVFAAAGDARAARILEALAHGPRLVPAENCDDKYFVFFHLNSLLLQRHAHAPIVSALPYPVGTLPAAVVAPKHPRSMVLPDAKLFFFHEAAVRAAVALARTGAVHAEGGETIGNYVFRSGGRLYQSEVQDGACDVKELAGSTVLELPLVAKPVAERTRKVQSLSGRFALGLIGAFRPLAKLFSRWVLKRVTRAQRSALAFGTRRITFSASGVIVTDRFALRASDVHLAKRWCFTDGHSTRLYSEAEEALVPIGDIAPGTERSGQISLNPRAAISRAG
jgi:hypothetical protein